MKDNSTFFEGKVFFSWGWFLRGFKKLLWIRCNKNDKVKLISVNFTSSFIEVREKKIFIGQPIRNCCRPVLIGTASIN